MTSAHRHDDARRRGSAADSAYRSFRPPSDCPVCGDELRVTRLGCGACGSELSGVFETCSFCGLGDTERDLLRVFLVSRGNLREVARHLGVSYPTARQRYAELLARLGLEPESHEQVAAPSRDEVLAQLARGEIDVETAAQLLRTAPSAPETPTSVAPGAAEAADVAG